jgi:hypothetical protein
LFRLAKRLARRRATAAGTVELPAAKAKVRLPSPGPLAGNGASHAHEASSTLRTDEPLSKTPSSTAQRALNRGLYHTRYFIEIYGSLKPDGSHLLIIDRKTRIKIDWLQFILLLILASHARSKAGLDCPMDLRGGDYLQPSRIEEIIQQLKAGSLLCAGGQLPECQNAYDADLLRNAKYDLRLRIARKCKNPNLLDRGDGAGYRISTPPTRIKITLLMVGFDDLVFDWKE